MNARIRVCEIVFSLDIEAEGGGITRFTSALSQALDPDRFEPVLCGLWDRGSAVEKELVDRLSQRGIHSFTCARWNEQHPYRAFLHAYRGLRTIIKRQPVDIVHSHSEFGDVAAMLLKLEGISPVIVRTLHNGLAREWQRRPARRLLLSYLSYPLVFDHEIGVSPHIAEYLDSRWLVKISHRKGLTINNAVDLSRFREMREHRESVRQELGIPQNAYTVGSVGRLGNEKGYDLLIEAAAQIIHAAEDIYIVIIGDGKLASFLKHKALEAGIDHKIIFTGARPDVERLLSSMDLFVCSSRWEGLSTAIMEAMAAGVPIVATDIPGNREILSAGKNAWLVPAEDTHALARAILHARHDPDTGRVYAQQARADVLKYGIDRVAAQHGQLYQSLLNG